MVVVIFVVSGIYSAIGGGGSSEKASPSTSQASTATESPQPDATPEPTVRPLSRKEQKRNFLQTVDESISGARIAGNPFKFVGTNVDLHCVVDSIPQAGVINASCPPGEYGGGPNIVIQCDTTSLERGQSVRVIGTVVDPVEGTNSMGGQMRFPSVKAEFME